LPEDVFEEKRLRWRAVRMLSDVALGFILVLATSILIYVIGRRFSPRSTHHGNAESSYACGEDFASKMKIHVSLYKYLVYFVVIDSSVILIAFASIAVHATNILIFMLYLVVILLSGLLLVREGET
jgi:NADH:ubiquinone oxidoreductase subunit 3 (subunit A)